MDIPPSALAPGDLFDGRYQIVARIGMGGLATTYRALDLQTRAAVVLKVLNPGVPHGIDRLEHEASILQRLHHPNIVALRAFHRGSPTYLVLDWIEGRHLGQAIRSRTIPFDVRTITPWLGSLCDTLTYLDGRDIVHRDLKPDNILITPDNRLVLIDFNVALDLSRAATDPYARQPVGSPTYAAPEQMAKRAVDHRADIYALGVILFEMLTLTRPFTVSATGGDRWEQMRRLKTSQDAPSVRSLRPDLPPDIAAIVDRALARDPAQRWQHAAHLWRAWLQALDAPEAILHQTPQPPETTSSSARPASSASPFRRLIPVAILFLLLILIPLPLALGLDLPRPWPSQRRDELQFFQNVLPMTLLLDACDTVHLKGSGGVVVWQTCVERVDIAPDALLLHVRWVPQFPAHALEVEKPSDEGNPDTYLVGPQNRRYHAIEVHGDAARDIILTSGQTYRGAYLFPRPHPLSGTYTFVEANVGIEVPFRIPATKDKSR